MLSEIFATGDRNLKLNSLQLLQKSVKRYHGQIDVDTLQYAIIDVPKNLGETDLRYATLELLSTIAVRKPKVYNDSIRKTIWDELLICLRTGKLPDEDIENMEKFLCTFVSLEHKSLGSQMNMYIKVSPP